MCSTSCYTLSGFNATNVEADEHSSLFCQIVNDEEKMFWLLMCCMILYWDSDFHHKCPVVIVLHILLHMYIIYAESPSCNIISDTKANKYKDLDSQNFVLNPSWDFREMSRPILNPWQDLLGINIPSFEPLLKLYGHVGTKFLTPVANFSSCWEPVLNPSWDIIGMSRPRLEPLSWLS